MQPVPPADIKRGARGEDCVPPPHTTISLLFKGTCDLSFSPSPFPSPSFSLSQSKSKRRDQENKICRGPPASVMLGGWGRVVLQKGRDSEGRIWEVWKQRSEIKAEKYSRQGEGRWPEVLSVSVSFNYPLYIWSDNTMIFKITYLWTSAHHCYDNGVPVLLHIYLISPNFQFHFLHVLSDQHF